MKKIFSGLVLVILLAIFTDTVQAADNFSTTCNIVYTVNQQGLTHAQFNFVLTNNSSLYRASSYSLTTGFADIENVAASDPTGLLNPEITKQNNQETIKIVFRQKEVGKGNQLPFQISFDTADIAQKQGLVWELNIPGILQQTDFADFTVDVKIPASFGTPVYIKPEHSVNNLHFSKAELGKSGVSIGFGSKQIYKFNLIYHLENKNLFPIETEIALPPNTNYQLVNIDRLTPKPKNVKLDQDGNWLASYDLNPSQRLDVNAVGAVQISLQPKTEPITDDKLNLWLQEKPYWQVNNSQIKALAARLQTPRAIFQYVVDNLKYDFSRVTSSQERLGAVGVLTNPNSAVCLEFSDLFVALARAANIPARELDGFAYTQNQQQRPLSSFQDILHAWPEYYDKTTQEWIMVDPTWQNTTHGVDYFNTLDFDHFVLSIRGISSTYPIPAGGYKTADTEDAKDVNVTFGQNFDLNNPTFSLETNLPSKVLSGLPISGNLVIKNLSPNLLPSQNILIETANLQPLQQTISTGSIPPDGFVTLNLNWQKTNFLTNEQEQIKITAGNKTITRLLALTPFFWDKYFLIGGIVFVIICTISLSFIAKKAWNLLFS